MGVKIKLVLVQEGVSEICIHILNLHGIETVRKAEISREDSLIRMYDAIVVRPDTYVNSDVIGAAKRLKLIALTAPGFGHIDVEAASRRKISVINAPNATVISVSELICGLVLAVAKQMRPARTAFSNGVWKYGLFKGQELKGRTVAIIGCGRVGKEVATRLSAFNMKIIGYDPLVLPPYKGFDEIKTDLNEIWPIADYILLLGDYVIYSVIGFDPFATGEQCKQFYASKLQSIDAPTLPMWLNLHECLLRPSRSFIDGSVLQRCKTGVKIVNVGRGGLMNEADLLYALNCGKVGGAAIDVFEGHQRDPVTLSLIQHPAVLATPHIATSTPDIALHAAKEVAEQIVNLVAPNTYTDTVLCELNKVYDKILVPPTE